MEHYKGEVADSVTRELQYEWNTVMGVTECIVYMFRPIPFNLFFPVLFLFDWVRFLWPNYLRC